MQSTIQPESSSSTHSVLVKSMLLTTGLSARLDNSEAGCAPHLLAPRTLGPSVRENSIPCDSQTGEDRILASPLCEHTVLAYKGQPWIGLQKQGRKSENEALYSIERYGLQKALEAWPIIGLLTQCVHLRCYRRTTPE